MRIFACSNAADIFVKWSILAPLIRVPVTELGEGEMVRSPCSHQMMTCEPNSTTRLAGRRK